MLWLALLLALVTVGAIVYPLLRPRSPAALEAAADPLASELASAKEATYAAIKELEFDYRAGSLSKADYSDLETRYKRKAATLLQAQDARQSAADRRSEIEAEVRRIRSQPAGPRSIEEEVLQVRRRLAGSPSKGASPAPGRFCTQCGAACQPQDRFCAHCGHPLSPTGSAT